MPDTDCTVSDFSTNIVHDVMKEEGSDMKSSKELINQLGNDSPTEHTGQWTGTKKCTYPSDYSEKSLSCLGDVDRCAVFLYEGEGGYLQRTMETDNHEVQSDKSEKLLIRCNVLERNLQM